MNTKIVDTLRLWVPESGNFTTDSRAAHSSVEAYELLQHLANHCVSLLSQRDDEEQERLREIFKVVNMLYKEGNQHTRNAIENEFLTRLAEEESPRSLRHHMDLFPQELRRGYIKTILEN